MLFTILSAATIRSCNFFTDISYLTFSPLHHGPFCLTTGIINDAGKLLLSFQDLIFAPFPPQYRAAPILISFSRNASLLFAPHCILRFLSL